MNKIKIYIPPEELNFWHIDLPFKIEKNLFELVPSIEYANFLAFINLDKEIFFKYYLIAKNFKINFLRCWYTHNSEVHNLDTADSHYIYEFMINEKENNFFLFPNDLFKPKIIHIFNSISYDMKKYEKNIIFYDYMFNRQKLFFIDINENFDSLKLNHSGRIWTGGCTKERFKLNKNIEKKNAEKKFLAPNRNFDYINTHPHSFYNRHKLRTFLIDYARKNEENFFYSDWRDDAKIKFLHSEEMVDKNFEIKNYYENNFRHNDISFQGWNPIANFYYEKSFVSVYIESLVHYTEVKTISEKTFDPILKGHFVLPFGYPKMVNDLKHLGFLFPDFIDYSYDLIDTQVERFEGFMLELNRLNSFDLEWFQQKYDENKWILEHNKRIFYEKPYDSLYEKLKNYTNLC